MPLHVDLHEIDFLHRHNVVDPDDRDLKRCRIGWVAAEAVVSRIERGTLERRARARGPSRILKRNNIGNSIRDAVLAQNCAELWLRFEAVNAPTLTHQPTE